MYQYKLYSLNVTSCLKFKFLEQSSFFSSPDVEITEEHLQKRYNDEINKYVINYQLKILNITTITQYKKYKLEDVVQAHKDLEARKIIGPSIIIP